MGIRDDIRADSFTYSQLFRIQEFQALFASRTLSTVGDYLARAALVIAVYSKTGSAALMGVTFALATIPDLIGGPLLAGLSERYPRRAVMVCSDLARALLLLSMAIPGEPLAVLWALLFVTRLLDSPFNSSYTATMSVVLPGEKLLKGFAATQLVNHLSYAIGYTLGGLLVAMTGVNAVLLLNAATFTVSALIIVTGVRSRPRVISKTTRVPWLATTRESLHLIAGNRRLILIALFPLVFATTLTCEAVAAPYATELGAGAESAGILMGAKCIGIVIGLWGFSTFLTRNQWTKLTPPLAILNVAPLLVIITAPGVATSALLFAISGIAMCFWIPLSTEFTQHMPDNIRGQSYGLLATVLRVSQGVVVLLAGVAAQYASPSVVIAASAGLGLLLAVGMLIPWKQTSPLVADSRGLSPEN